MAPARSTVAKSYNSGGVTVTSGSPPPGNYVQRGHTITTVRESEKTTSRDKRGNLRVKTKNHTVYYVDGKAVKLNWFDRLRIRFMSNYEKQAFLAEKLLRQEQQAKRRK